MLRQATGNDQLLPLFGELHQGAHRFLTGVLDEAAGVHHHHAGLGLVGADAVTGLGQQAKHVLGIHPVLFAAEVGKGHGGPRAGLGARHGMDAPFCSPYRGGRYPILWSRAGATCSLGEQGLPQSQQSLPVLSGDQQPPQ